MSGKILVRAAILLLALVMSACGGDESSSALAGSNNGGSGSGSNSGNGGDGTGGGGEQAVSLELGTGSGSGFQSGQMNASATNLSAGGSTRLEFNVVNAAAGNSIYNAESTTVTVSSLCSSSVFDETITTSSGSFTTTYEAGCAGADTITARLPNGSTATGNVTVAAPEVGELEFLSVSPDSIALSGSSTSTRPSVSRVEFQLNDRNGNPITTGEDVGFSVSTTVGGISLSQETVETTEEGIASTRVNAGTVPTVVSVTATYTDADGNRIQTTSAPISISASIPDDDSFSISVENFQPNAWRTDGVEVGITIRAADRNNNRVSDAVVNFITNAGSIEGECVLTNGACEVTWVSQSPRANDQVVEILARTVGEESFIDLNSDGVYTAGADQFLADIGEAFLDRNQNGTRDPDEEYFDYNESGDYTDPNGIYNGTACVDPSPSTCTTALLEISESARIFQASDVLDITFTTPVAPGQVCVEVAGVGSVNDGPPPLNTSVDFGIVGAGGGEIIGRSSFTNDNNVFRTIPFGRQENGQGEEVCIQLAGSGTLEVTASAPGGSEYVETRNF